MQYIFVILGLFAVGAFSGMLVKYLTNLSVNQNWRPLTLSIVAYIVGAIAMLFITLLFWH